MKRLRKENINTPQEYDRIFEERRLNGVDNQDMRRWKRLIRYFKGGTIIDIGCLDSYIPALLQQEEKLDFKYYGIDVAKKAIRKMEERYKIDPRILFNVKDGYNTKLADDYFDYVTMGEVIEHMEEPEKIIAEAIRILKPGGRLALSTPLNEAREKGAVDAEHHLWSFTLDDMKEMMSKYGRVITFTLGSEYIPTYKYHYPTIIAFCRKK